MTNYSTHLQGRMKAYSLFICIIFCYIYRYTSIKIKLESKKNILKLGYRINYKYKGMLAHYFDRFYVVTKSNLPSIKDLNFLSSIMKIHVHICKRNTKKYILDLLEHYRKIKPYVDYYKQQIKSYNNTAHHILKKLN